LNFTKITNFSLKCFQSRHDIDLAKHVFPTITRIYGQPFHEQPESIIQPL